MPRNCCEPAPTGRSDGISRSGRTRTEGAGGVRGYQHVPHPARLRRLGGAEPDPRRGGVVLHLPARANESVSGRWRADPDVPRRPHANSARSRRACAIPRRDALSARLQTARSHGGIPGVRSIAAPSHCRAERSSTGTSIGSSSRSMPQLRSTSATVDRRSHPRQPVNHPTPVRQPGDHSAARDGSTVEAR
jgi:hypothetical protein